MNELALFAGAGGGILGGKLLGWRTVCAVEWDQYAATSLAQRQNDGHLEPFPIWDEVQTFDGRPWRGRIDVVSGGFPCQDISVAGRGKGIDGERSGMWKHMARIVGQVRPRFVFVENSPALISRGLGRVIGDLSQMGYDSRWCIMGADDAGAPHRRKRIWILAHLVSTGERWQQREGEIKGDALAYATDDGTGWRKQQPQGGEEPRHVADTYSVDRRARTGRKNRTQTINDGEDVANSINNRRYCRKRERCKKQEITAAMCNGFYVSDVSGERQSRPWEHWFSSDPAEKREGGTDYAESKRLDRIWGIESRLGRVAHGVAHRLDRLKAIGNGQVPSVAAFAFRILSKNLYHE